MTILLLWIALLAPPATADGPISKSAPSAESALVLERSAVPTVGTEGRLDVLLSFDDLKPAVTDARAKVIVRIAERRPWGTGTRYDLRYITAVPGEFDLGKLLRRPDGTVPELPPLTVSATGLLAKSHDGSLVGLSDGAGWRWPWYGWTAAVVIVVWLLLLVPFLLSLRRPSEQVVAAEAPTPTLADRLRPLVEAAARGELDAEGRGQLERLLLHVWRRRIETPTATTPAATLRHLHQHAEAGPLLRALETWLHRPPGRNTIDSAEIARLLEPYRDIRDLPDAPAGRVA